MVKIFEKIKSKLPKRKAKADMSFFKEHEEEFRFFVKYYPAYQQVAIEVGKRELAKLNADKPCQYRAESDIPFRSICTICATNGKSDKSIKDCKECKVVNPDKGE